MANLTVDLIGHTDNSGNRASNTALSQARADAVKGYLITKGIASQQMTTTRVGPDQPIAPNDMVEGRARNRRIEFGCMSHAGGARTPPVFRFATID